MNIAAYMAALRIEDLDHSAKHAVQVIAGRASRYTASVELPIARIAADMGVNYTTAQRALNRAVRAGYLAVDKAAGRRPMWRLPRESFTTSPREGFTTTPGILHEHLVKDSRTEESLELTSGVAAARFRHPASGARSGENPYARFPDWTGSHQARVEAERNGK